ncbi:MAG: hypothetical protein ACI8RW_000112 [Porticoccaceae bacterium]
MSISNAFAKLEGEQLIKRSKGHVELLDTQKLTAISDDINRYREVDISWFPNV